MLWEWRRPKDRHLHHAMFLSDVGDGTLVWVILNHGK